MTEMNTNNTMNTTVDDLDKEIMSHVIDNDTPTNIADEKTIRRLILENKRLQDKLEGRRDQKNNQRLWDESHKPVSRFVIDEDEDGYVTVREVIDSANGEVELSKEKFSYHDLKMLAVYKTVDWNNKRQNGSVKDFVKGFAGSFTTSFLMSYGIGLLVKSLIKK